MRWIVALSYTMQACKSATTTAYLLINNILLHVSVVLLVKSDWDSCTQIAGALCAV